MAARKLQAEMDRNFKKIQEGVENFEDIESKMNAAGTPAQKEKLEADLKTQIKKLQRLRDQLKTWQAGSDVKDKAPIIEHRRLIEVQMERFKMIEKEMKTKAYSTVGLISHSKLDPKEQQRLDLVQWLQARVEDLQQQVETAEAELETLHASVKRKGKAGEAGQARVELLELQNERRNWHITQLEIILRLVENSSLKFEDVEGVKDDVDFFVTMNSEEDFEYDDGVYAELNLEDYVEADMDNESTIASDNDVDDPPPRPSARKAIKVEEDDSREDVSSKKTAVARRMPSISSPLTESHSVTARAKSSTKPTETTPSKPPATSTTFTSQPMSSLVKSSSSSQRAVPTLPPLRYAAAAAMGTSTASQPTPASAHAPQTPALTAPPPRVPTPPPPALPSSLPANATPPASTTLQHATPASKSNTPASDPAAPLSPSEQAVSSAVNSPVTSPVAIKERDPSTSVGSNAGAPIRLGSFGGGQSAASVTSMSLASPVVSLVEAAGTSPQQSRMPNISSPYHAEAAHPLSHDAQSSFTLQGILPQHSMAPPPGLVLNGVRDANNASTLTAKPDNSLRAGTARSPAGNADDMAVGSLTSANNGVGAIGPAYAANSVSPVVSANGHDDRTQPKFAATLSDLISSFKTAEAKAPERIRDGEQVKEVLEIMSPTMPEPRDAEQPRYHNTRNPMATPSYYPQQMLPLLASPEFFERLDVETLFWVFYYMPGTYQQWLAAQELKKQSWRFHVKFLTWFQRHAKPDEVTDEYEQGQYLYFDWEGSWCVRKKSDFRFEYRNLSDD